MGEQWDNVGVVLSSQYRVAVLRRLSDGPATPSSIAGEADINIAHVSRAIQNLKEREMVELLVSEDRQKGRIYGITEKGEEIWEKVQTENLA